MQLVPILFGVACGASISLASLAPKKDRDICAFLAVLLLASWAASNVAWLSNALDKLALMDGAILALSFTLWLRNPYYWRSWFFVMAAAQLVLDISYGTWGRSYVVGYLMLYNLTFAGEIVAVAWGGGRNVVERVGRAGLRRLFGTFPQRPWAPR